MKGTPMNGRPWWTLAAALGLIACAKAGRGGSSVEPPDASTTERSTSQAATPPPGPHVQILKFDSWKSAFEQTSMMMEGGGKLSTGHLVFATWASRKLLWFDVIVATNETSYVLVAKDPDKERGKRICLTGWVASISANKSRSPTTYDGMMRAESGHWFGYTAVHDTDKIVADVDARFCGVVTDFGRFAFSKGGTVDVVSIVGMFDLPSNRKWIPADVK